MMGNMDVFSITGSLGDCYTAKIDSSNNSQKLTDLVDTSLSGETIDWGAVKGMYCSCEDNNVRMSFGVIAGRGIPVGHMLYPKDHRTFNSNDMVNNAYIISSGENLHGSLMVTLLFDD